MNSCYPGDFLFLMEFGLTGMWWVNSTTSWLCL